MVEIAITSAFLLALAITGVAGEWAAKKFPAIESWINSLPMMMEQEQEEEQTDEADRRAA